jgi:hypothetical protein
LVFNEWMRLELDLDLDLEVELPDSVNRGDGRCEAVSSTGAVSVLIRVIGLVLG